VNGTLAVGSQRLALRALRTDAAPEIVDGRHRFELFVAIERYCVPGQPVEDRGDPQQSRDVGVDVAAELDLEIAIAVRGDHLFQRRRLAVVRTLHIVAGIERVEHADRMPRGDRRSRLQAAQKSVEVEPGQIGSQAHVDAGEIGPDSLCERDIERAAKRIEQRAVDQRRAIACGQRIQAGG